MVGRGECLIEVLHGQDLSRLGPVEPGIKFSGTTLWSRLYSLQGHAIRDGAILPVGSSAIGLVWPNYTPIDAQQLQLCIDHGQQNGPPPSEWLLIRDANSLCAGQDYRRAVLDAGLAAELAVTSLIRTHLTAAGHADIENELRTNSMLGRLSATGSVSAAEPSFRITRHGSSTGETPPRTRVRVFGKPTCATRSPWLARFSTKQRRYRSNPLGGTEETRAVYNRCYP